MPEIKVPALGESIVEATVGQWRKQVGDTVAVGEIVVELETDKVSIEVTAEQAGVLEQVLRAEGQSVGIGEVLGLVGVGGLKSATPATPATAASATSAAASAAPAASATSATPATPATAANSASAASSAIVAGQDGAAQPVATPVARNIAEQAGVDVSILAGSGPGGRVTKGDVLASQGSVARATGQSSDTKAEDPKAAAIAPPPTGTTTPVTPSPGQPVTVSGLGRPEERVRMSRRRQTIARRLVEAQQTAAMLTTFNEIDMGAVMDLRKKRRDAFKERHGVGLGFMSFFTKAVIGALRSQPLLNAEIQGDEIVVKKYYDIGIAVSTSEGLVVPVLRDADQRSFAGIEKGIEDLAKRAREGKLTISELQGGTFTITNGGIFGSLMSTPILNAPQVGILGMHKIQDRPMVVAGQIAIRPMMYVALSYDHRIVDGSEAVRFLVRVKELVEDPEALLLEG